MVRASGNGGVFDNRNSLPNSIIETSVMGMAKSRNAKSRKQTRSTHTTPAGYSGITPVPFRRHVSDALSSAIAAVRELTDSHPFACAAFVDWMRSQWDGEKVPPRAEVIRWIRERSTELQLDAIRAASETAISSAVNA